MRVGVIGFGNMGSAFAQSLSNGVEKERIIVYDKSTDRVKVAKEEGFSVANDLYFLVKESDILLLAVKPKDIPGVLEEIKGEVGGRVIVSIAAGIPIKDIERIVGGDKKVVRLMPNINVLVGRGAIAVTRNRRVGDDEFRALLELFSSCGSLYEIPEELFDGFTALGGSAPAFVFAFIDALAVAGVREGFGYRDSLRIAVDTVLGSAFLLREMGGSPSDWMMKVASPGGTTVEGIAYLEERGFKGTVIGCIERTLWKAKKLKG